MLFGAMKRKTQRFNAKSAGVTSTMLLFAVIGAFAPTLFYQIYGTVRPLPDISDDSLNCGAHHATALVVERKIANAVTGTKLTHLLIPSTSPPSNRSVTSVPSPSSLHTPSVCGSPSAPTQLRSGKCRSTAQNLSLHSNLNPSIGPHPS